MRKSIVLKVLMILLLTLSIFTLVPSTVRAQEVRVLLLQDGASEGRIQPMLEASGFEVVLGGNIWQFRGRVDLDTFHVVMLLHDAQAWVRDMEPDGQQALVDYVRNGGGMVTTEWVLWSTRVTNFYRILRQAFVGTSDVRYFGTEGETYTVLNDHPIASGLPIQFTFSEGAAARLNGNFLEYVILQGSRSRDAVIAGPFEGGRVVHWSLAPSYRGFPSGDANIAQLLTNMIYWAAGAI